MKHRRKRLLGESALFALCLYMTSLSCDDGTVSQQGSADLGSADGAPAADLSKAPPDQSRPDAPPTANDAAPLDSAPPDLPGPDSTSPDLSLPQDLGSSDHSPVTCFSGGTLLPRWKVPGTSGTWQSLKTGTINTLYGVWGSSAKDLWVVGDKGTILHYDGKSFRPACFKVPGKARLNAVWGDGKGKVYVGSVGANLIQF